MSRFKLYARDPVSSYTHFIGAILSIVATFFLSLKASDKFAACVFGVSMVLLYTASCVYHFYKGSPEVIRILRKLDHSMIYVLIAGTYTPILLVICDRPLGSYLSLAMWGAAVLGAVIKLFWINAPRWLSAVTYVAMGWVILINPTSLVKIGVSGILWLVAGGVLYTVGAVIYALKKPNLSPSFGFHEIFHLFVMLGTFCHFVCVYFFVI